MKIKFLFLAILLLNVEFVRANDICNPDSEIVKIGKSVSYPNCLKNEMINSFQEGDIEQVCTKCKKSFEIILNTRIQENSQNLQ